MEIRFLWKSWSVFSFHLKFHLKHRHEKQAKIRNETHSFCKILEIFEMIFSKNNQLNFTEFVLVHIHLFPINCSKFSNEIESRQLSDGFINFMRIKQYAVPSIESHIFEIELSDMFNLMHFVFLKDDEPLFMNSDSINHISHTFFSLPHTLPLLS